MLCGLYEAEERLLMGSSLRAGQTVLDVGANVGYLTRFFARITGPSGRVYAFEPNPITFSLLQANIASLTQVKVFNFGLSSENSESTLFLAGNNHAVGSFCAEYPATHVLCPQPGTFHSVRSQLINGDQFLAAQGVDKIDVLKIDVEGWELNVLQGLEKTIARSPNIVIFCEFNRAAQTCAGHPVEELPVWFLERGFTVAAPQERSLQKLFRNTIGHWIEQLPAHGYATLFASRARAG